MRTIGLISGTSYDAIEASVAELELAGSELRLQPLGAVSVPYPAELRRAIAAAPPPAAVSMETVCRQRRTIQMVLQDPYASLNPRRTAGCPFHPRCPLVEEICVQVRPELAELLRGQRGACHVAARRLGRA